MLAFPQFSMRYSSLMFGSVSAKWFELLIIDVAQRGSNIDKIAEEGSARARIEMKKKYDSNSFLFQFFIIARILKSIFVI